MTKKTNRLGPLAFNAITAAAWLAKLLDIKVRLDATDEELKKLAADIDKMSLDYGFDSEAMMDTLKHLKNARSKEQAKITPRGEA